MDIKKLKKIKNIFFLNEVKHEKLPSYIHGFDLGIIPYKVNKFTNSVYSCKLNEYLSMGLPVVSTKIRESNIYNKNFNNIISIGKTYEQFNIKIRENIKNNSKDKVNNRIKAAKKNSWESRFNYFNELIEKKIFNKSSVNQSWKSKFIEKYNKFFYTNIKKTSLIILIFILIFKTPIIPLLGSFLIVQDEIKNTKVMIVFSGDGENNYHNLSFQKRIIDILNIKKKYPNIKIILSGRAAVFNESEIVKSLLINDGVSKKDITTIKEDPYNTYENIAVVNKLLKKNDVKKIIFLTSPYHTYRSKRIWNKNFPEVKVVIPKMIDTPDKKLKWSISYQEIKIIFYEYLAILYNKYKGWI